MMTAGAMLRDGARLVRTQPGALARRRLQAMVASVFGPRMIVAMLVGTIATAAATLDPKYPA